MVDNVGSLVADVLGKVLLQHSQYDTINTVNRDRHEQGEEDVDQFSVVPQLAQQHSQYGVIHRQDEEEEDGVSVISLVIASLVGSVAGQCPRQGISVKTEDIDHEVMQALPLLRS